MFAPDPILAPSLLGGDHSRLADSAQAVAEAGCPWLHLDIMDGHFVPNLSFGPQVLADLRKAGNTLFFDTHLMLSRPDRYIEAFAKAGADRITLHVEPDYPVAQTLAEIEKFGCKAGITLNPDTEAAALLPFLGDVDLVLVMTVQPGFGGQSFRFDQLEKIKTIAQWRRERGYDFRIQVDGGVDLDTGPLCTEAGADTFVAGSAFFRAEDKHAFRSTFEG